MLRLSDTDQQGQWENAFPEVYTGNLFQFLISANDEIRQHLCWFFSFKHTRLIHDLYACLAFYFEHQDFFSPTNFHFPQLIKFAFPFLLIRNISSC